MSCQRTAPFTFLSSFKLQIYFSCSKFLRDKIVMLLLIGGYCFYCAKKLLYVQLLGLLLYLNLVVLNRDIRNNNYANNDLNFQLFSGNFSKLKLCSGNKLVELSTANNNDNNNTKTQCTTKRYNALMRLWLYGNKKTSKNVDHSK